MPARTRRHRQPAHGTLHSCANRDRFNGDLFYEPAYLTAAAGKRAGGKRDAAVRARGRAVHVEPPSSSVLSLPASIREPTDHSPSSQIQNTAQRAMMLNGTQTD